MDKIKVGIAGASGYAGMTLVGLLSRHPEVEITQLATRSLAGKPYSELFPLLNLGGNFCLELDPDKAEVIFSCLPHNQGANLVTKMLSEGLRVIDLSADFRLHDKDLYPRWYQQPHPAPELLEEAVLGLPELHAMELPGAKLIAVPGCYSTASILALAPAVSAGLVKGDVIIDGKSGVSGAGRSLSLGTHFSEVDESLHSYAIAGHRHLPEIEQELGQLSVSKTAPRLTFVPHLIPTVRGLQVTCYFDSASSSEQLTSEYRRFYQGHPFTSIADQPMPTKLVTHTNHCLINLSRQGDKVVVSSAIDNLVKGAAGQAVEAFNLAFGFERTAGLQGIAQWP